MCGIAGFLGTDDPKSETTVARMVAAITHRGPNTQATRACATGALGHARLSIIDVHDRALQPMADSSGRYTIVFNGEIYNYKELRSELIDRCSFSTESDTEVLLAAYRTWGSDCLERLIGMFAFCIYDALTREAFFARDRFGQKPLFFYESEAGLLFASEIKALFAAGAPRKENRAAWRRYLKSALFDDGPETFFAGVSQLQPGECALHRPGAPLKRTRYYVAEEKIAPIQTTLEEASQRVRDLMIDAVRIHMRADVPVGISLSGGLDSSAILTCLGLGDGIPYGLACFSMEYGDDLTERPWIDAAARRFGLSSTYRSFTKTKFVDSLARTAWHQEAPIGGLPNCALEEVAASARAAGVVVLQDGTGLDEAFGGYRNHHNLYIGMLLRRGAPEAAQALADYARNWGVTESVARQAALAELAEHATAIDGSVPVRPDLLTDRDSAFDMIEEDGIEQHDDPLRASFARYLQHTKIPRNMRMKDRATMAFGIELRLPFLDHRLIEYALSLPEDFYFRNGWSKSIVRSAMAGAMDDSVRLAPKRSVQAPQEPWLRSEPMRSYVRSILDSDSFADRGFIDPGKAKAAYDVFCREGSVNSFFVWQWVNLEEWFRRFIDADPIESPHPACPSICGLLRQPVRGEAFDPSIGRSKTLCE